MARQQIDFGTIATFGALGVGGFLLWERFKPQNAAGVYNPITGMYTPGVGAGGAYNPLTGQPTAGQPTMSPPLIQAPGYVGVTPSNLNPGAAVGGPVGTCMQRKPNWTQGQCQTRLNNLVSAYYNAKAKAAEAKALGNQPAVEAAYRKAIEDHRTDYFLITGITLT